MKTYNRSIASGVVLNANYNSPYTQLKNMVLYTIVAIISGTPTGTVKLQASNDPETNDTQVNSTGVAPAVGPSNWVDIADSAFAVSTAGKTMWNVTDVGYNYVRVVYIDASSGVSTATMAIVFNGKGV